MIGGRQQAVIRCAWVLVLVGSGCQPTAPAEAPPTSPPEPRPPRPAMVLPVAEHEPLVAPGVDRVRRSAAPPMRPIAVPGRQLFVGSELSQDAILERLRQAQPTSFKPVGSTSTVFRTTLDVPMKLAFKSATRDRPAGPSAEAAAYRLARCLGLSNVPPAVSRRFSIERLRALLLPEAQGQWAEIRKRLAVDRRGRVSGVAIYWIPSMYDLSVDTGGGISSWSEWLKLGGQVPDKDHALAGHISSMLVFDYLIANWDRFSGGNAKGTQNGKAVYLRDHDMGFAVGLNDRLHRRVLDRMLRAERFSESLYLQLKQLSRERFEQELAEDPGEVPLLSGRQINAFMDRRRAALSHIESLVELHGVDRILVFR